MQESRRLFQFEGYEVDPAARSVRRGGQPVPLTPKTFDLLLYLVRHPHQLVTKEELLTAVWAGSFVEEGNLSQHVFLLRKALAGTGQAERIVVTIPGKGYQFTAPVRELPLDVVAAKGSGLVMHASQSITRLVVEEETDDEAPAQRVLADAGRRRGRLVWAAVTAALVSVTVGSFLAWQRLHPAPAGHIDLVLSEIENSTGDPDFDRTLNRALMIDLEQSPFLSLLTPSRIGETLAEMQRKKDEVLTPALALEICERNNAQAILHGAIAKLGSKYLVILGADSCVSGKQIAGYKAEAGSKEEVLGALDTAAGRVRKQLGESAASLERFQTPIAQATTPSLDALRAYSQALERADQGDMKASAGLAERAIALDPNFASAYRTLSIDYYNQADFVQASAFITTAFDLRERTTERERLAIEIAYYAFGVNDYEATIRSMKLFNQIYPNSANNWGNLCNMYTQLGEYPEAIDAGEHAYRIDPHSGFVAEVLARAYKRANRFADAKRVANASVAAGNSHGGIHSILFQVAYAEHDADRIKKEGEWGLSHQHANESLEDLAAAAATGGKLREAVDDFSRSRSEALRGGDRDFADAALLDQASVQVTLNEPARAAETLKQLKGNGGNEGTLAALRAELGDLGAAQRFVAATSESDEKNTIRVYCELPRVRALLAFKAHKPGEAVQVLEPARPYQLRNFTVPYLRAQAETEAGALDAAAADYRLILDNQGVDPIAPEYSLAHLRLARVLVLQKHFDEARIEYRTFFQAWKDADADLAILHDAKREFAQLH